MGKILIAGASGSLGFEVLKKLNQQRADVRVLVSSDVCAQKICSYTGEVVSCCPSKRVSTTTWAKSVLKDYIRDIDLKQLPNGWPI